MRFLQIEDDRVARVDVIMPQMGESIAEGTVSRWLKKVGDNVKRDEPLFEISTDKVDAEIPSPTAGILVEILIGEGQTVAIQTVVARLETDAAAAASAPPAPPSAPAAAPRVSTRHRIRHDARGAGRGLGRADGADGTGWLL
jgi:pyruvate dehydrogenase E2 component (dihydrolipoamide acetyltransferase)